MKKSFFVAGIAALALVACKKTETVETANATDSLEVAADSTINVIDSTETAAIDSVQATAEAATDTIKAGVDAAK
ncbi:hypothetical protein FIC_02039 [Flavobacteriaceae bacterium 3519-10]|nr:hypothetical protein FIC_02039 [Flavobacteriaceae bacterium 3519-10]